MAWIVTAYFVNPGKRKEQWEFQTKEAAENCANKLIQEVNCASVYAKERKGN